jgi:ABC-type anion transport system duplicated permease subunit
MLKTLKIKDYVIAALLITMLWMQFRTNNAIIASQVNFDKEKKALNANIDSIKTVMIQNEQLIQKSITRTEQSIKRTINLHKQLDDDKKDLQEANDSVNIAWFHAYIDQYRLESGKD